MSAHRSPAFLSALSCARDLSLADVPDPEREKRCAAIGAEIPNQLQAVSEAIDALGDALNDHATQSPETKEIVRNARAGLANVLDLARVLRGGR